MKGFMVLRYNETESIRKLASVPRTLRVAFAAVVADRLLPSYVRFCAETGKGDAQRLIGILDRVWLDLAGEEMSADELASRLDTCMRLIPDEDDGPWVESRVYADDASTADAYTLRTRQSGDAQEAAWAARCAYESLDHYVIHTTGIDAHLPGAEERIITHPLIQSELGRQQRDIDDLLRAASEPSRGPSFCVNLRARAKVEAMIFFGSAEVN